MEDKTLMIFISLGVILLFGGFFLFFNSNDVETDSGESLKYGDNGLDLDVPIENDSGTLAAPDPNELNLGIVNPYGLGSEIYPSSDSNELNFISK